MDGRRSLRLLLVAVALCVFAPTTQADENVAITVKSIKPVGNGDFYVMVTVTNNDDHAFDDITIACAVLSDTAAPSRYRLKAPDTGGVDFSLMPRRLLTIRYTWHERSRLSRQKNPPHSSSLRAFSRNDIPELHLGPSFSRGRGHRAERVPSTGTGASAMRASAGRSSCTASHADPPTPFHR